MFDLPLTEYERQVRDGVPGRKILCRGDVYALAPVDTSNEIQGFIIQSRGQPCRMPCERCRLTALSDRDNIAEPFPNCIVIPRESEAHHLRR